MARRQANERCASEFRLVKSARRERASRGPTAAPFAWKSNFGRGARATASATFQSQPRDCLFVRAQTRLLPRRAPSSARAKNGGEPRAQPPRREGRRLPAPRGDGRPTAARVPRGAARRQQLRGPTGQAAGAVLVLAAATPWLQAGCNPNCNLTRDNNPSPAITDIAAGGRFPCNHRRRDTGRHAPSRVAPEFESPWAH
jgi:hypothetical protein